MIIAAVELFGLLLGAALLILALAALVFVVHEFVYRIQALDRWFRKRYGPPS